MTDDPGPAAHDDDPRVGDISERQLLRSILARLGPTAALVGPGDDAAVLAVPDGRVVASVDTLVHGPDFRLAWSTPYDLGYKSAAVNLADIAAMGARPTALLVALALPNETRGSFVEQFADGLRGACGELAPGCAVEGGDLTVSDTLTVAVTALGTLDGREPVLRSGAGPGDVVALAGEAGAAARGLDVLFRRFRDAAGVPVPVRRDELDPGEVACVTAQLRPAPPIALGPAAADAGATAMMDVSDGIALDATRLAEASAVTVAVDSAALGARRGWAVDGGEDHGLLATFPPGVPLPPGFRIIGQVRARADAPLLVDDEPYVGRAGWDPYRDWDAATG
ncbi:MAG: thiamine-phosphate kinase [Microbacterium sp.]|uniref:thiamine-phosphate kinase n=1 Tax=Microbacterium sp. TaxID=51671 RepID=UPI003A87C879